MQEKNISKLDREAKTYQDVAKDGNLKWQKKKNKMTHLTPKKKKRK